MKAFVFESTYGYNTSIRPGKIYFFQSNETVRYLLQVNPDLILLNRVFNIFIMNIKKKLKMNRDIKLIQKKFKPEHLFRIQLGERTRTIINEILGENNSFFP